MQMAIFGISGRKVYLNGGMEKGAKDIRNT